MNVAIGEPSPEVEVESADATEVGGEGQGEAEVADVVNSDLPDDTLLEIDDPTAEGGKRQMTLKELKGAYRHRSVSDQRFTEADKARKTVQAALRNAVEKPESVLEWIATQKPDFKTLDFFFKQLESSADPQVIDRLAQLLDAKLKAEEAEKQLSPADRRVKELEAKNQELEQRWEQEQDRRVEMQLFDGVKGAIEAAGLNPSPLVAVAALEIIAEAQAEGIEMTPEDAAALLKDHYRTTAEKMFAPEKDGKARDESGKFVAQAKAKAAPGALDAGGASAAKRAAKEQAPRVSVVKPSKKKEAEGEAPQSFLQALRSSYSGLPNR